jgi:hypothetical protein
MFIREYKLKKQHTRVSKAGKCDNCDTEFERARGSMDPKRLNNNYFHVCKTCDSKKFAQRKGVERKQIWNMPASSDMPISNI